eukprot:1157778-Pelagomonas_calceolata.AAC.12
MLVRMLMDWLMKKGWNGHAVGKYVGKDADGLVNEKRWNGHAVGKYVGKDADGLLNDNKA